ncbi:magnesium/cobalt transporter CorA [Paenimyroides tangerinum]|uniref:Magnesium transport protein CorA n=1 Tax=Paenimyroides tangerinum TaxID=2488728 RepID=A0A3P3VY60_9FLAO|nr:magnesium/cobalt transporter CorA [Paenimyroides tangerinum]RRJ87735.1 magnesium/cobalt transporter CorA [Paenimyroides tangerinum]
MKRVKFNKVKKLQPYIWEYNGNYKNELTDVELFIYDEESFFEQNTKDVNHIEQTINKVKPDEMIWFNLHGFNDVEIFPEISKQFSIPLSTLNQVLSFSRRTRWEEQDGVMFFNLKATFPKLVDDKIQIIPISFVIKENQLFSFQEKKNNLFEHIRERIRTKTGNVRKKKEDYLLYLMLDAIMENYFLTLDNIEDEVEKVIIEAKTARNPIVLEKLQLNSDNLNDLKRALIPIRDVLFSLKNSSLSEEFSFLEESNQIYFSRLHHKSLEIIDQIDYDLNQLNNASSFFFSMQSHRMNEIMKVLTVVSVIFMPLTFIVGIYGMNFKNMPELNYENGYYIVLSGMFILAILMALYFKYKKWF